MRALAFALTELAAALALAFVTFAEQWQGLSVALAFALAEGTMELALALAFLEGPAELSLALAEIIFGGRILGLVIVVAPITIVVVGGPFLLWMVMMLVGVGIIVMIFVIIFIVFRLFVMVGVSAVEDVVGVGPRPVVNVVVIIVVHVRAGVEASMRRDLRRLRRLGFLHQEVVDVVEPRLVVVHLRQDDVDHRPVHASPLEKAVRASDGVGGVIRQLLSLRVPVVELVEVLQVRHSIKTVELPENVDRPGRDLLLLGALLSSGDAQQLFDAAVGAWHDVAGLVVLRRIAFKCQCLVAGHDVARPKERYAERHGQVERPAFASACDGRADLVLAQVGHPREEPETLHSSSQRKGVRLAGIPSRLGGFRESLGRRSVAVLIRVVGRHLEE